MRVHAVNVLHDVLDIDGHAESGTAIEQSMRAIEAEGRGVIVLIRDLRPKSVSDWVTRTNDPRRARRSEQGTAPSRNRRRLADPRGSRRQGHGASDDISHSMSTLASKHSGCV